MQNKAALTLCILQRARPTVQVVQQVLQSLLNESRVTPLHHQALVMSFAAAIAIGAHKAAATVSDTAACMDTETISERPQAQMQMIAQQ